MNCRPISAPLLEDDSDGALAGEPAGWSVSRYGSTLGMPSFGCTEGYPRGRGAAYTSARARAAGEAGAQVERTNRRRRIEIGMGEGPLEGHPTRDVEMRDGLPGPVGTAAVAAVATIGVKPASAPPEDPEERARS